MALRETPGSTDSDLFRQELVNLINLRHPLAQLAQKIDWKSCETRLGGLYKAGIGRPGHPIRLMVGLQLLKHTSNLSDEEVVAVWVENPYWRHFCGEQYFCHDLPIDPSLMTLFRKRTFPGNPYDGHILSAVLEQATNLTQDIAVTLKHIVVDLGFRGVDADNPGVEIIHRGKFKSLSKQQKGWLKRRTAVEPAIGHLKSDHRMARCWLQGALGDALHDCVGLHSSARRAPALDDDRARTCRPSGTGSGCRKQGNRAAHAQKNDLKPWRRLMWCIGALTEEYRQRMYNLLELYARPLSQSEPVICIDEKSLQLIGNSRAPLPIAQHTPAKQDYEYTRHGTTNLFVAVEPKAGQRIVSVTERRGKVDFVDFIGALLTGAYAKARRVHRVLDNLNTHFRKCFDDVLGQRAATKLLRRVQFHYTPKHASWLNMAKIEIGILSRQCLDRRIASRQLLRSEVDAWQQARNVLQRTIEWKFTRQDADTKLGATLCFETFVLMY